MLDDAIPETPADDSILGDMILCYTDEKLAFVDHYWMHVMPEPIGDGML